MKKYGILLAGAMALVLSSALYADYAVLPSPFPAASQPTRNVEKAPSRVIAASPEATAEDNGTYGFASERPATGNKTVIFDPRLHAWAAYDASGKLVKAGRASGGSNYCPDIHRACRTPAGTFSVASKGGPGCKSTIYPLGKGGAPMPYCMFFNKNYALHGSYDVPAGRNASHGCVRLLPSAAAWLSQNFVQIGTTVIVRPY